MKIIWKKDEITQIVKHISYLRIGTLTFQFESQIVIKTFHLIIFFTINTYLTEDFVTSSTSVVQETNINSNLLAIHSRWEPF